MEKENVLALKVDSVLDTNRMVMVLFLWVITEG
jgi:hypothetical protein